MTSKRVILAVLLALLLGLAFGYLWRRWRAPTLSEKAQDAAAQLKGSVERLTK